MKGTNYSKDNAKYFDKGSGKAHYPTFNLKVSEDEKHKDDHEWFKNYMKWIVPEANHTLEDYDSMKLCYDVVNNNLDGFKDKLKRFCNPMDLPDVKFDDFIEPQPKIHNKINVLKGELLKRGDNFKVILLSAKAIKEKNKKLIEAIQASVEQEVMLEIQKLQAQMQEASEEEIEQITQQLRDQLSPEDIASKDYLSEWELFGNKIIKYAYFDQEVKMKQMDTFSDICIADRCFIYSGWKYGKPHLEVRNTLFTGFHKSPNNPYVQKGDYVWYKDAITIADVMTEYGHLLSDDDIADLGVYTNNSNHAVDKRHDVLGGEARGVFDHNKQELAAEVISKGAKGQTLFAEQNTGNYQGQGHSANYLNNQLVWRTHFEFKAFKELIFLKWKDEYGEEIITPLSSKAKSIIPPDAEKVNKLNMYGDYITTYIWTDPVTETPYEASILWIPRKYEVIRLGNSVYPICREVPFQVTNINSPYSSFELSTKGMILNARNAPSISLVQRALPSYFEFLYVKKVQNEELAKYQGYIQDIDVDQIPDELGEDEEGEKVRDKVVTYLTYLKKTNKNFYSGSQGGVNSGLPPATRSPGSRGFMMGTAMELYNLQNLADTLDREIGMAMGISPQRESMFSANSNVTDNQQAITQSHHITEPYFYLHSQIWRAALNDYLKNFRQYCLNQFEMNPDSNYLIFDYITQDGIKELLKITPDTLDMEDMGLWVSSGINDQRYLQLMEQFSFSIAQNGGEGMEEVSAIVKAITSEASPIEVHRMIQIQAEKQKQRTEMMQQKQQEHEQQLEQMRAAAADAERAARKEEIILMESLRKEREVEVMMTRYGIDSDRDNIPDVVQQMRYENEKEDNEKKRGLDEREIERKEKADKDKKEIELKKIAAMKDKPKANK